MKILIFCLPGIGDALMSTPMIRVLKDEIPDATIEVATMFDSVSYIFKNNKAVDKIHYLPIYRKNKLNGLKSILDLRKIEFDISILSFPAFRREYHLVQWLVGAKKRIAHSFSKSYFSELHFLNTDLIQVDEEEHNVVNNLNLLKILNIDWEKEYKRNNFYYDLELDNSDMDFGNRYIKNLGWKVSDVIGIHPGSINSPSGILKRWPIERFADVASTLIKKKKKILIFFGPFEVELGEKLCKMINDKKNVQLVAKTTFNQSLGVLNTIHLLITNDNGFAHLANALKVHTITLFGPTNMNWCAPFNKKYSLNIRKAKFTPWFRSDMKVENPPKNAKSGMEEIRVDDVLAGFYKLYD